MDLKKINKIWYEAKTILIAIGIAVIIRTFIVEPYKIPTGSMEPTLLIGDHILVRKYEYGIRIPLINKYIVWWKKPKRGDVIVFRFPVDQSKNFVKRIIGLPGETIEIRNKQIFINNKPFKDVYGMYSSKEINPNRDNFGPIVIPSGYYFVMGDNRDRSNDSRMWALELGLKYDPKYSLVEKGLIKGKVYDIYWSVTKKDDYAYSHGGSFIVSFFRSIIDYFKRINWERIGKKIYM